MVRFLVVCLDIEQFRPLAGSIDMLEKFLKLNKFILIKQDAPLSWNFSDNFSRGLSREQETLNEFVGRSGVSRRRF